MEKTAIGYKWTWEGARGRKARLAYFITKVCGVDQQIPYKRLESLFGETRLDSSVARIMTRKNEMKWMEHIDVLFND